MESQGMDGRVFVTRRLTPAYVSSLAVAAGIAVVSIAGLSLGPRLYEHSQTVLISLGSDAANLAIVLPALLVSMWAASRGSVTGLLLWPGALFYALYAYVPYLLGAPFSGLFFGYVAVVVLSAFAVIRVMVSIDGDQIRQRFATAPARGIGAALTVVALLAYAGLVAAAIPELGNASYDVTLRAHAVADWALGTPVLLAGGVLLWRRAPLGYVTAAGLLLVSAMGGVVFAAAAMVDNLAAAPQTDAAVIVVHLGISSVSLGLLVLFLRGGGRRTDGV